MDFSSSLNYSSFVFNVFDDDFISIFNIKSLIDWAFFGKLSVLIDRDWWIVWVDNTL